jgi:hypothetical protein
MEATLGSASYARSQTHRFHLWMAVVFVLIAFGGFTPTYWAPVATGRFHAPPIVHIHGVLLFSWTLFYLLQTVFVASGRIPRHRAWGLFGISLFSVMVCSILVTRVTLMHFENLQGFGEASLRFSAIAFCSVPLLVAFFALAISNIRRPEIHKRFMYLLMSGLMIPALARVFLTMLAPAGALGPPPPFVVIPPTLTASLLIVVAIVYDWRSRGKPHPVYVYGGIVLIAWTILIVPFANTSIWLSISRSLRALGG